MARILVIDDDEIIRFMLTTALENEGYEVENAINGIEGIKQFHKNPADLIITDIIMPEKEGIETIAELKNEFPDVKIIAMSSGGSLNPETYLKIAKKVGALRAFLKPFEMKVFIDAINELIRED